MTITQRFGIYGAHGNIMNNISSCILPCVSSEVPRKRFSLNVRFRPGMLDVEISVSISIQNVEGVHRKHFYFQKVYETQNALIHEVTDKVP